MIYNSFDEYLEYLEQSDYYEVLFSFDTDKSFYYYYLSKSDIFDLINCFYKYKIVSVVVKKSVDQFIDNKQVLILFCHLLGLDSNNNFVYHTLPVKDVVELYQNANLVQSNIIFCDDLDTICGFDLI
jgi:hypothetical protein